MWVEKGREVAIRYVLVLCLLCLGVAGRDVKVARFAAGGASYKRLANMLQGSRICTVLLYIFVASCGCHLEVGCSDLASPRCLCVWSALLCFTLT
jgi:hypothetical protein